jgi:hypothetical protein
MNTTALNTVVHTPSRHTQKKSGEAAQRSSSSQVLYHTCVVAPTRMGRRLRDTAAGGVGEGGADSLSPRAVSRKSSASPVRIYTYARTRIRMRAHTHTHTHTHTHMHIYAHIRTPAGHLLLLSLPEASWMCWCVPNRCRMDRGRYRSVMCVCVCVCGVCV